MVERDRAEGEGDGEMKPGKVTLTTIAEDCAPKRKPVNGAAKGAEFERKLADYFVQLGYSGARRMIRAGTVKHADEGDIDGLPFTVQAKNVAHDVGDTELARWLHATGMQRLVRGHGVGLLIVKRNGHSAVGSSWAWIRMPALVFLTGASYRRVDDALADAEMHVRIRLDDLAPMLVRRYPPQ